MAPIIVPLSPKSIYLFLQGLLNSLVHEPGFSLSLVTGIRSSGGSDLSLEVVAANSIHHGLHGDSSSMAITRVTLHYPGHENF